MPINPATIAGAKWALDKAAGLATAYFNKAQESDKADVTAAKNYLEGIYACILGLEIEYDQILIDAKHVNLDQPKQTKALKKRINAYLNGRTLLPLLERGLTGLESSYKALGIDANRFLLLPSQRKSRQISVVELEKLLQDLRQYYNGLIPILENPITGVGLDNLLDLHGLLESDILLGPAQWESKVQGLQTDRDFGPMMRFAGDVEKTANNLRAAFR
jgi:hypothetical protein